MNKYDKLHMNIDMFYFEKEEDHSSHMKYKEQASKIKNIPIENMRNKKYNKNPAKADLYYKGREELINRDETYNRDKRMRFENSSHNDRMYNRLIDDIRLSEKDIAIKSLNYMKKHSDMKDEKEFKKYKLAFNIFCRRFHIPENSSLWVKFYPGFKFEDEDGTVFKRKDAIVVGSYTNKDGVRLRDENHGKNGFTKERKLKLPNGYKLIHRTDDRLEGSVLKPSLVSQKFTGKGPANLNGQYHDYGRAYFTLVKDKKDSPEDYGKNAYVLVDKVDSIYFDTEHSAHYKYNNNDLDNLTIDKLLNKPVYIKTNKPVRVKKI